MATLRALRLLQSIESKNINSTQLETLLAGNASRKTDLPLLFGQRAATERILAPETFPTILGSSAATTGLANSTLAMTKIAASLSAMGMVANSLTGSAAIAATELGYAAAISNRAIYAATVGKAAADVQALWMKAWRFVPIVGATSYTAIASNSGRLVSVSYLTAIYSDDGGKTWVTGTGPSFSAGNICHAGDYFFALPSASNAFSFTSSSYEISFNSGYVFPASKNWWRVAKNSSTYLAIAHADTAAATSSYVTSWAAQTLPVASSWNDLAASSTTFLLFGNGGTTINIAYTSASGASNSWITRTLPSSQAWNSAAAGTGPDDGKFMMVSNSAAGAFSSNHGATWSAVTLPAGSNWGRVVYHAGSRSWIAFSSNTSVIATSLNDGATWSTRAAPAANIGLGGAGGYGAGGLYVLGSTPSNAYLNF